jgi:hypothetical protein
LAEGKRERTVRSEPAPAAIASKTAAPDAQERFLELIVLASGRDRFNAMGLRREKGVEAAIEFLNECTLSQDLLNEPIDDSGFNSESQARNVLDRALTELHALGDMLTLADRNCTFADETVETVGSMVLERSTAAREALTWIDEHPESEGGAA